jgi:alanine dehydrogenase
MKIGVPKEIKPQENRIGLTPESVKTLVSEGHEVIVENNGGFEAGFENEQYTNVGAKIANSAADIFNDAEIIVKVKEPQKVEVDMIRENQIVYTYLHLAAAKELTEGLIKSKSINIAYETVTDDNGRLPFACTNECSCRTYVCSSRSTLFGKKSKRQRITVRWSTRSFWWKSCYFRWWSCW